jgi:hypothetical protein
MDSEKYIGYLALEIANPGLTDYVEQQFRNPVHKPSIRFFST